MPNTSSYFNLLEDVKDKFPGLSRKEIVSTGSYIWNQLTWEEKYPYMVKAWRSKRKHSSANEPTGAIKSNFVSR
ncbi:Hypothetical protein NTJ_02190 [Nesidiocoris tenuis]|uniref:HMG box domain-containing protein n=1 Tax=Nesidiocoris tenuis TaxID=355587 RepID=A0ABN7AAQ9_9HEMI|nr:Hypothetical protein NTJ_02190 [Nesidiocoris tenuis]